MIHSMMQKRNNIMAKTVCCHRCELRFSNLYTLYKKAKEKDHDAESFNLPCPACNAYNKIEVEFSFTNLHDKKIYVKRKNF